MGKVNIKTIFLVLGAFLLCFAATKMILKLEGDGARLQSKVFRVDHGYGYEIYSGTKLLIKQDFIPAIEHKVPFRTFKEAKRVANLVSQKLLNYESPEISAKELDNLNIAILKDQ